jgi:hypothetical protein
MRRSSADGVRTWASRTGGTRYVCEEDSAGQKVTVKGALKAETITVESVSPAK